MSFSRNLRGSIAAMAITTVVGLVALGLLARILGPDEFGGVALILAIFNFFIFFDGTRAVIVKLWHRSFDDRAGLTGASLAIAATLAMLLFLGAVAGISVFFDVLPAAAAIATGIAIALHMPLAVFWGILDANERIAFTALLRAGAWSATYFAFVVFAWLKLSLVFYAFGLAVMNLFLCVVMGLAVRTFGIRPSRPAPGTFALLLGSSLRTVGFNILSAAITVWDRLVLAALMPIGMLGIYSIQVELGVRGRILVNTFSRVLYPRLARQFEEEDPARVVADWIPYLRVLVAGIYLASLVVAYLAEPLLRFYAGPSYAEHAYVLVAVMAMLPINAAGMLAVRVQRARLDFRSQPRAYAAALALGVVTVWPLVTRYGIAGAAAVFCLLKAGDLYLALRETARYSPRGIASLLIFLLLYAASFSLLLAGRHSFAWLPGAACFALLLNRRSVGVFTDGLRRLVH